MHAILIYVLELGGLGGLGALSAAGSTSALYAVLWRQGARYYTPAGTYPRAWTVLPLRVYMACPLGAFLIHSTLGWSLAGLTAQALLVGGMAAALGIFQRGPGRAPGPRGVDAERGGQPIPFPRLCPVLVAAWQLYNQRPVDRAALDRRAPAGAPCGRAGSTVDRAPGADPA